MHTYQWRIGLGLGLGFVDVRVSVRVSVVYAKVYNLSCSVQRSHYIVIEYRLSAMYVPYVGKCAVTYSARPRLTQTRRARCQHQLSFLLKYAFK